ncbi:MAG TPA: sulfotransferase [Polyangia bacterium]|nr:sulfotransferase [Polyangia bacterium]
MPSSEDSRLPCVSVSFAQPIAPERRELARAAFGGSIAQVWSEQHDRLHLLFANGADAARFSTENLAALGHFETNRNDLPSRGALVQPIFVIAAPRSGSTLLFELLAAADEAWTVGDESHRVIEGVPALATDRRGFESDRLTAADATPQNVAALHAAFLPELRASDDTRWLDLAPADRPRQMRLVEKTPKNSLRVSFLLAAFPDARIVFLYRAPAENLGSIVEAWRSGWFVSRPSLPGWSGAPWSLLLPPGWRALDGRPLEEIAAYQWQAANRAALDDLEACDAERLCVVDYHELVADPRATLERLCRFAGVTFGERLRALTSAPLQVSRSAVTPPDPAKWRRLAPAVEALLPSLAETHERLRAKRRASAG